MSVPVNTAARGELLRYYLSQSDCESVVVDASLVPRLAATYALDTGTALGIDLTGNLGVSLDACYVANPPPALSEVSTGTGSGPGCTAPSTAVSLANGRSKRPRHQRMPLAEFGSRPSRASSISILESEENKPSRSGRCRRIGCPRSLSALLVVIAGFALVGALLTFAGNQVAAGAS